MAGTLDYHQLVWHSHTRVNDQSSSNGSFLRTCEPSFTLGAATDLPGKHAQQRPSRVRLKDPS